jgi:glycosyltransferase involved in cell wall biosynthesis
MLFDATGRVKGGAERYALELARHSSRQADVRLLSFGDQDARDYAGSLSIRIIGGDWDISGRAHDPVSRKIVSEIRRADVIHCHQREVRVSKTAALLARSLGKLAVVTDHGGGAWSWSSRIPAARLFHRHLHVSEFSRRLSGQEGWSRAAVVGAGVDVEYFRPDDSRAAGQGGPVLFVGRLLPHKGVDVLIDALPPGISLQIVGPVLDRGYLAGLQRMAHGKDVTFHHTWDDVRLAKAYRECLCVVLPSVERDRDGRENSAAELLGQTLLEGMASGRPTVCTPVGGMPEVVVDQETGFLVKAGDPRSLQDVIARLAGNLLEADALGRRGRARVETRFTWPGVVQRCFNEYQQ